MDAALHYAAARGHVAICALILETRSDDIEARARDVNEPSDVAAAPTLTPLLVAAAHNRSAVAEFLISRGADVYAKDRHGFTALHFASTSGFAEIVETLLLLRAKLTPRFDVNTRAHYPFEDVESAPASLTALHAAALFGHATIVRLLIDAGAEIEAHERNGYTPLRMVAGSAQRSAALVLLNSGADALVADNSGGVVLEIADQAGLLE